MGEAAAGTDFLWQDPGFTQWEFIATLTLQIAVGHWNRIFHDKFVSERRTNLFFVHSKHVAPNAGQKKKLRPRFGTGRCVRAGNLCEEDFGWWNLASFFLSWCEKAVHAWESVPMSFLCMCCHRAGGILIVPYRDQHMQIRINLNTGWLKTEVTCTTGSQNGMASCGVQIWMLLPYSQTHICPSPFGKKLNHQLWCIWKRL